MTKIVIFRPDEARLPDSQKTYFTEVSMGFLENDRTDFLEPNDLFVEGNLVGVDRNRLEARLGHSDLDKLIMPAEMFRRFLEQHKKDNEE
ncbi:hypothetical protein [Cohnella lubricantis]|uniref:Uncharacterized protein n=1 Tax=Cohnella lubricantis TaxID=2163172 RepID=A0A841T8Q0_9BACL|nr:hypothetical protein [Cohnella lubricantis]MBB6676459.1 hypothetical protein [Cohnella lubricantis]MBP2117074.1 hypothetical protein [Cohnella lubricantis]